MNVTNKKILLGDKAQLKLLKGMKLVSDPVSDTIGPLGRNIVIARVAPDGGVYETVSIRDGYKVAKEIFAKDEAEQAGVDIIKQAIQNQVDEVGDGTSVTSLLSYSIAKEALKITSTGVNPMPLKKELENGAKKLTDRIESLSIPVKTKSQMVEIATISAQEPALGELIATTIHDVGKNGVVTLEESKTAETVVEKQEGMQFSNGYISAYFVTDQDRNEATVEDAYILLTDKVITNAVEFENLFKQLSDAKIVNLVVIAQDITGSALATFIVNKMQGRANILCVKAPMHGNFMKDYLADIATLTGGKVISEDIGDKFEDIKLEDLGQAKRVTSTKDATLIVDGAGDKKEITKRISSLQAALDRSSQEEMSDFNIEKIRERIGKLSGGVSVIKIGGQTKVELDERMERADDALHAVNAAIADGIVPGGEIIYLNALDVLDEDIDGEKILKNAVQEPFKKLVTNAGYDGGEKLAEWRQTHGIPVDWKEKKGTKFIVNKGLDVTDGKFKDMIKSGIIDPTAVPVNAIKNAVSVAVSIMTSKGLIVPDYDNNEVEKKK